MTSESLITHSDLYRVDANQTVIGGSDPEKFVPNVNIGFDCESPSEKYFFNINRPSVTTLGRPETFTNNSIKLTTGDESDIWQLDSDGNLKWDVELISNPASNIFEWSFTCSGDLQFYLQPVTYSDFELLINAYRPDHIKGSYAVFLNKQGHYVDKEGKTLVNYRQGKILHIPRPLCYDSKGTEAWGELYIEKTSDTTGVIRITVPQEFIDKAVYPVTIDPTFGYTSVPGTEAGFSNCYGNNGASAHTASTGDTITKYSAYIYYTGAAGAVDATAYTVVAGELNTRFAAGTTITAAGAAAWADSGAVSQVMSNGVTYGPAIGDEFGVIKFFYDAAPAGSMGYDGSTATLPATWTESGPYAFLLGLYATYTAGAPSGSTGPQFNPLTGPLQGVLGGPI